MGTDRTTTHMHEPSPLASRRRLLSTVGAVAGVTALAGCSSLWNQTGATDVVAYNAGSETKVVAITITDSDSDEAHTARTLELAPAEGVDPVNDSKLPTNASYTVEVVVEDGPSETFEWDDPDVELAPLYVMVDDSENVRFLLRVG